MRCIPQYIGLDNEVVKVGYIVMSKEQIQQYLDRAKNKNRDNLRTYLSSEGSINDVDYYVEVMKRYYPKPNDGPLVIKFRRNK